MSNLLIATITAARESSTSITEAAKTGSFVEGPPGCQTETTSAGVSSKAQSSLIGTACAYEIAAT